MATRNRCPRVVLFNLGGVVGMLVAGRASDRFGAPRTSAIWFARVAALRSARRPVRAGAGRRGTTAGDLGARSTASPV
ncbi:hypothetical protein ACFYZJ_09480 [Streptomyces sp. NPDC001848]|uniref:hypothetical protein n=1 Tax=Streptomyces sp. NPDC001848 TaxID=3364618 RepID=UPI003693A397